MGRRVDSVLWEQRRELVKKQLESGLSAGQFCRDNSLNLNNFQAWKRRLKRSDQNGSQSKQSRVGKKALLASAETAAHPAFVQIPNAMASTTVPFAPWIEVSLAEGIVVRVPATNLAALRMVLSALKPASEVNHA